MRSRTAVSVHNDLAPGEASVAVGATNIELAGGVDVPHGFLVDPALRQSLDRIGLDDVSNIGRTEVFLAVLMGDDNLGYANRLAILVTHGHLAFSIWPEVFFFTRAARQRDRMQNLVGIVNGCRHEFRGFTAGITKHDALIAGAFILVAGGINALGNIGRLRVQQHFDVGILPMKTILLVTNIANRFAGGLDDTLLRKRWSAHFAGNHQTVGRSQRLAGHADLIGVKTRLRTLAKVKIDDFVRNPVAPLVRMAFGHGFTGE